MNSAVTPQQQPLRSLVVRVDQEGSTVQPPTRSPSVFQIAHATVRRDLRTELLRAASATEFGSVVFRATAALYALLLEHAIDRQGRCYMCRQPASMVGPRRRQCTIYPLAQHWIHQPGTRLAASLNRELGLPAPPPPGTTGPVDRQQLRITGRTSTNGTDHLPHQPTELDTTDALTPIAPDWLAHSPIPQSPAASCPPPLPVGGLSPARRPDPDHGEAGEYPDCPRPHRGPPPGVRSPRAGGALLVTGAAG